MSVIEAYEDGKKAFLQGRDLNNIPGHYSSIEKENFIDGYRSEEAMHELANDHDFDLEDPSISELDFN